MSWRSALLRSVNGVIGAAGWQLQPRSFDFDDRLESPTHLAAMHGAMAAQIAPWLERQTLFVAKPLPDLTAEIATFYAAFLDSPFRRQLGESRYNNCLWLYLLARSIEPDLIIDSGTYTGASSWALSRGAPAAKVASFDIDLSNLKLRLPTVTYVEADWTTFDLAPYAGKKILVYFDDHVDQARRLLEARARGIPLAIFDDDFTLGAFPAMAHDGAALPKVEFVLDETLRDGDEIVWRSRGQLARWRIDRGYLDRARAAVRATERVPNTSLVTGIHQTPYRIVSLHHDG